VLDATGKKEGRVAFTKVTKDTLPPIEE